VPAHSFRRRLGVIGQLLQILFPKSEFQSSNFKAHLRILALSLGISSQFPHLKSPPIVLHFPLINFLAFPCFSSATTENRKPPFFSSIFL